MLWSEFRRNLSEKDRQRLVLAIKSGLREFSAAAETIEVDGDLSDLRRRILVTAVYLEEARHVLDDHVTTEGERT